MGKISEQISILKDVHELLEGTKLNFLSSATPTNQQVEERKRALVESNSYNRINKLQIYLAVYATEVEEAIENVISIPEHNKLKEDFKSIIEILKGNDDELSKYSDSYEDIVYELGQYITYVDFIYDNNSQEVLILK